MKSQRSIVLKKCHRHGHVYEHPENASAIFSALFSFFSFSGCPCTIEEFNAEPQPKNLLVRQSMKKQEKGTSPMFPSSPKPPFARNNLAGGDCSKTLGALAQMVIERSKQMKGSYLKTVTNSLFENKPAGTLCEGET